jgi:hypothetical protein
MQGVEGHRAAAVFEQAATRLAAQARRLDDLAGDVRQAVHGLHWTGRNADHFRRHAAYQAVRAGQNREIVESLRVLCLRAAADFAAEAAKPPPRDKPEPAHHPRSHHDRGGVSGGGEG